MSAPDQYLLTAGEFPTLDEHVLAGINRSVRPEWRRSVARRLLPCPAGESCPDNPCDYVHPFSEAQKTRLAGLLSPVPGTAVSRRAS